MVVLKFIWYCICSMFIGIKTLFGGHVPADFDWKRILAGSCTFALIILVICIVIIVSTKKNKK